MANFTANDIQMFDHYANVYETGENEEVEDDDEDQTDEA